MRRGDIHLVDLSPARGSEANKRRPAIIVSNDGANATARRLGRGVITGVPATSHLERGYKAPAEQIRSVAVVRVGARLGVVPDALMLELEEALRLHLGM